MFYQLHFQKDEEFSVYPLHGEVRNDAIRYFQQDETNIVEYGPAHKFQIRTVAFHANILYFKCGLR